MLWSDPDDKPSEELRDAQKMLRRLVLVVAMGMVLLVLVFR
jgi:hypothetical protein